MNFSITPAVLAYEMQNSFVARSSQPTLDKPGRKLGGKDMCCLTLSDSSAPFTSIPQIAWHDKHHKE